MAVRSCSGDHVAYLLVGLRGLLFAVFAVSVGGKLRSRAAFAAFGSAAGELTAVGRRFVPLSAAAVIVSELAVLAGLGFSSEVGIGFGLAAGVLAVFTGVLGTAVLQRRRVRCRCFGADGAVVGVRHLVRNGLLVGIAVLGLFAGKAEPRHAGGFALAVAAGLVAGLILSRWDDLAYLMMGDGTTATDRGVETR